PAPDERESDDREDQGPHDRVAEPQSADALQREDAENDGTERDDLDRIGRWSRTGSFARREQQPPRDVERQPEAARDREELDREAHDVRIDAERLAESCGNTRDEPTVVASM